MIRDLEIQRLVNYAKGLGLRVIFSSKKDPIGAASWSLDNTEITIYKKENAAKIDIVLSLIHEIGHALHNVHEKNRETDPKFEKALDHVDEAEELEIDSKKKQRKIILDNEIAGSNYWHQIYKETNMKFPVWKLDAAMEFDLWQYEEFYKTGEYPNGKERKIRFKEINKKHRGRNE